MIQSRTGSLIKMLLIDDHEMVRLGIRTMLSEHQSFRNFYKITEAESAEIAINKLRQAQFDLLIVDYNLPGMKGDEFIRVVRRTSGKMPIIGISNFAESSFIRSMLQSGADGFVMKSVDAAQLQKAIETVMRGEKYFSSDAAVCLIENNTPKQPPSELLNQLTSREKEVLRLIAQENSNEQISSALCISKRTVDTHRQHLLKKLQVKNTAGLVKIAIGLQLA